MFIKTFSDDELTIKSSEENSANQFNKTLQSAVRPEKKRKDINSNESTDIKSSQNCCAIM